MLNNLGLHVIQVPTGKYAFVGSIPVDLLEWHKATTADVMGQRAHRNKDGELVAWKSPLFESYAGACAYAAERGHIVQGESQ